MSDRQTTGGRLTKAERKEQARRERLELQRRMARARRNRRIALVLSALVVVGVGAFALFRPSEEIAEPTELLRQAAQEQRAAGCEAVEDVGPYQPESQDQTHIGAPEQLPPLSSYPSVPPASGPHNGIPLGAGVYDSPPPIDRLIHSFEHGAVAVWYSPDASGEELDRLRAFYDQSSVGSRVIVGPYDYPEEGAAGRLPSGTSMALVAWHEVQTCDDVNLAAAFGFTSQYSAPPFGSRTYRGQAPEAGAQI
jgi:hypothetical protein